MPLMQNIGMSLPATLTEDEELLLARTGELCDRATGGITCSGSFLTLGEQLLCRSYLRHRGKTENKDFMFFGGYPYAERTLCFCFPEYLSEGYAYDPTTPVEDALRADCAAEDALRAIRIMGSGYKTLTHRDYLGALLSLGIERHTLGDIAVLDSSHAILIARSGICTFLSTALERVGADRVHVAPLPAEELWALPDTRRYETITDTIASPRLDAIVAACANLSRDKAKQAVSSGLVELNFRPNTAPDTEVPEGAYISLRGVGRFLYEGVDGMSKKGRLRMHAKKLI